VTMPVPVLIVPVLIVPVPVIFMPVVVAAAIAVVVPVTMPVPVLIVPVLIVPVPVVGVTMPVLFVPVVVARAAGWDRRRRAVGLAQLGRRRSVRMRVAVGVAVAVRVAVTEPTAFIPIVREHAHQHQVHDNPDERDPKHDGAVDHLWGDQAEDSLVDEDGGHEPDDHDARQRADHLRPVVPERILRRCLAARQAERQHTDEEAASVRRASER
jgi:hypothetical protein